MPRKLNLIERIIDGYMGPADYGPQRYPDNPPPPGNIASDDMKAFMKLHGTPFMAPDYSTGNNDFSFMRKGKKIKVAMPRGSR